MSLNAKQTKLEFLYWNRLALTFEFDLCFVTVNLIKYFLLLLNSLHCWLQHVFVKFSFLSMRRNQNQSNLQPSVSCCWVPTHFIRKKYFNEWPPASNRKPPFDDWSNWTLGSVTMFNTRSHTHSTLDLWFC